MCIFGRCMAHILLGTHVCSLIIKGWKTAVWQMSNVRRNDQVHRLPEIQEYTVSWDKLTRLFKCIVSRSSLLPTWKYSCLRQHTGLSPTSKKAEGNKIIEFSDFTFQIPGGGHSNDSAVGPSSLNDSERLWKACKSAMWPVFFAK